MAKNCSYTICIDRLELVAAGRKPFWNGFSAGKIPDPVIISDEIKLFPSQEKKNPFYKYSFDVWLYNKPVACLYCGEKNILQYQIENPVRLNLHNSTLYEQGLSDKLDTILNKLELIFYKYSYLEIAIDGYDLIKAQQSLRGSKTYHRKQPLDDVNTNMSERTGKIKGVRPGSKYSDRHISFYAKQNTIINDGKMYIQEFWELNGLPIIPGRQIDRVELRLRRKPANYLTKDFTLLSDTIYLASFFQTYGGHYLEYIHNTDRKKRKYLINWSTFNALTLVKPSIIKTSSPVQSLKPVIKKLYLEFRNTGQEFYKLSYEQLANTYSLSSWLIDKIPGWDRDNHFSIPVM